MVIQFPQYLRCLKYNTNNTNWNIVFENLAMGKSVFNIKPKLELESDFFLYKKIIFEINNITKKNCNLANSKKSFDKMLLYHLFISDSKKKYTLSKGQCVNLFRLISACFLFKTLTFQDLTFNDKNMISSIKDLKFSYPENNKQFGDYKFERCFHREIK